MNFYKENEFGSTVCGYLNQFNIFSKAFLSAFEGSLLWGLKSKITHKDVYSNTALINAVLQDKKIPEPLKIPLLSILKSRSDGRFQFELPFSDTKNNSYCNNYLEGKTAFNDIEEFEKALQNHLGASIRRAFLDKFDEYAKQQPCFELDYQNVEGEIVTVKSKVKVDRSMAYRFIEGRGSFLMENLLCNSRKTSKDDSENHVRIDKMELLNVNIMYDDHFYENAPEIQFVGEDNYYPKLFSVLLYKAIIEEVVSVAEALVKMFEAAATFVQQYYGLSPEKVDSLDTYKNNINRFVFLHFTFFKNP